MPRPITVKIKRLAHGQGLPLPTRMTAQAAGFDLPAAVTEPVVLEPGEIRLIPCGFAMAMPHGLRGAGPAAQRAGEQARHHDGQRARHDRLRLPRRSAGAADQPRARRRSPSSAACASRRCSCCRCRRWRSIEVDELDETDRGSGGFGHTGH